jgi:hypothetical protein
MSRLWKLVLVSLAACGGGDDDGGDGGDGGDGDVVCAAFSPCGGDPAGEWAFVDACADEAVVPLDIPGCPDATSEFLAIDVSGTLSLAADGTYVVDQTLTFTSLVTFPLACIEDDAASCEEAGELLEADCAASEDDCACEQTGEVVAGENGTWEVDGADITITAAGDAEGATGQFCADGDRLELRQPSSDPDLGSSLILERR